MEREFFVQKHWSGAELVGPPKPLLVVRPHEPLTFTSEGVNAVAAALGIEPARVGYLKFG